MNFVRSCMKVVVGLAIFASLMVLEFTSYTRAVAEEVHEERLSKPHESGTYVLAKSANKKSKTFK